MGKKRRINQHMETAILGTRGTSNYATFFAQVLPRTGNTGAHGDRLY